MIRYSFYYKINCWYSSKSDCRSGENYTSENYLSIYYYLFCPALNWQILINFMTCHISHTNNIHFQWKLNSQTSLSVWKTLLGKIMIRNENTTFLSIFGGKIFLFQIIIWCWMNSVLRNKSHYNFRTYSTYIIEKNFSNEFIRVKIYRVFSPACVYLFLTQSLLSRTYM